MQNLLSLIPDFIEIIYLCFIDCFVILPIQVLWMLNSIQLNSVFYKALSSFAVIILKVIFLRENLLKSQSMLHIDNLWFG